MIDDSKNFRFNEQVETKKQRPVSSYKRVEAKFLKSKQDLDRLSVYSKERSTVELPNK